MTKFSQKYRTVLPAGALALLLIAGSPALALAQGSEQEGGASSGTSGRGSTSESLTSGSTTTTGSTTTKVAEVEHSGTTTNTEVHSSMVSETENENEPPRMKAEKMVKELKAEHKSEKTDEERTKACDEHKGGLETKFTSIARNSEAYKSRIDVIYARTLDFQKTSGLKPANFSSLVVTADAAKATAATSVTALASVKPTVDCASKTVATDVATFKVTATKARTDLKAYKQAVKAVVKSLRDGSEAAKPVTTTETNSTEKAN